MISCDKKNRTTNWATNITGKSSQLTGSSNFDEGKLGLGLGQGQVLDPDPTIFVLVVELEVVQDLVALVLATEDRRPAVEGLEPVIEPPVVQVGQLGPADGIGQRQELHVGDAGGVEAAGDHDANLAQHARQEAP